MRSLIKPQNIKKKIILLGLFFRISMGIYSQNYSVITGKIVDIKSNEPVPFASVCLIKKMDSCIALVGGTITDYNGIFKIAQVLNGEYKLKVSSIGHKILIQKVKCLTPKLENVGTIYLQDSSYSIAEAVVVVNRIQAKSEMDRTIYFINKKVLSATGNVPDLLRHIPGVQVDLKQNISLEGQSNILIYVDGKERDKSFVSQLIPSQIDKVEVLNTPPSNYDGNVSGVINIVLKKEKESGLSGNLFSEIPISTDVVYMFPVYSLNYNYNKINFYTSYNGEINFEDIEENINRQFIDSNSVTDVSSVEFVRQKNFSHKFHYGIDYHMTSNDIINFYGFFNNYSFEQDGDVLAKATGKTDWKAYKEETDKNRNLYNSLYYRHLFDTKGKELTISLSHVHTFSENNVIYNNHSISQSNTEKPNQTASVIKADFTTTLNKNIKWITGMKINTRDMHDDISDGFNYNEQVYAIYSTFNYKKTNFDTNFGIRAEDAETKRYLNKDNSSFSLLPYLIFHYKINVHSNLYLSYRRSVNRPSIYQLNSYYNVNNPYTISKGNPLLSLSFRNRLQLEYSTQLNSNYMSTRLFYEKESNAINNFTYLNDSNLFVTQVRNLGDIHQYGIQLTGALKFGIFSVNPSFCLYHMLTFGNNMAKQHGIKNKNNLVFESGISSVLSFKKDFALSLIFQYASSKENIQDNAWFDALYFISIDKTFKKNFKFGIVSALPFAKSIVYQGADIKAANFISEYTGNLKLPTVPIMFRISYRFTCGKSRSVLNREKESVDTRKKQGF